MSNFETFTNLTGGLPGTAPRIFSASTTDNLAAVETAGYLNDRGAKGQIAAQDILIINISDGDVANQKVYFGYVTNPSAGVYTWNFGFQGGTGGGGGGGGVSSFNTRTGAVVAASGDYNVSEVTGAAPLESPEFTGVPAAPTATAGTSTTQVATTAFVQTSVADAGYAPIATPTFQGNVVVSTGGLSADSNVSTKGNLEMTVAGGKLNIATGSNASAGVATLSGGSLTVSTTAVKANSLIFLTRQKSVGTVGDLTIGTVTAGTSFVIQSGSSGDDSEVAWLVIN